MYICTLLYSYPSTQVVQSYAFYLNYPRDLPINKYGVLYASHNLQLHIASANLHRSVSRRCNYFCRCAPMLRLLGSGFGPPPTLHISHRDPISVGLVVHRLPSVGARRRQQIG